MHLIQQADLNILLWLNQFANRNSILDEMIIAVMNATFLKGGVFFLFLWWLWFRGSRDPLQNRLDAMRIAAAVCLAIIIARVLQNLLPARTRPFHDPALRIVTPSGLPVSFVDRWSSFPSDHAVVYFALATAIWARYRLMGMIAFLWITLFALVPRVYVGLHYPSDIIVGAAIGAAVMCSIESLPVPRLAVAAVRRATLWEQRHPAAFYCTAVAITYEFMSMFEDVRAIGRGLVRLWL